MDEYQYISKEKISVGVFSTIMQNAGFEVKQNSEHSIDVISGGITSILYMHSEVIVMITPYRIKKEVDIDKLKEKVAELNDNFSFCTASIADNRGHLMIRTAYLTATGIYIPHFSLTISGFLSLQRAIISKVDLTDFII
ncbi:hypothetical protein [Citrobacter freundii]|uniref:hypothetical protein n=1 Tax=Citrobacter freundii TaxID=546 RepID=UPI0023B0C2CF|nr:hypothetical protein [Citrobacter freundii]